MNLIFVCPGRQKTFESAAYRIIENKGVVVDEHGDKTLDARGAPFAGKSMCMPPGNWHARSPRPATIRQANAMADRAGKANRT